MYAHSPRYGSRAAAQASAAAALLATLALLAGGCAKTEELVPVAGKVLIDGEPLKQGSIQFVPESGRPAVGKIGPDGAFRLSMASSSAPVANAGIKRGKYRIAVAAFEVIDEETESVRWYAPSQYAEHATSGLETNVTGPIDDLVLELSWKDAEHEESPDDAAGEATEQPPSDEPSAKDAAPAEPPAPQPEQPPPATDKETPEGTES